MQPKIQRKYLFLILIFFMESFSVIYAHMYNIGEDNLLSDIKSMGQTIRIIPGVSTIEDLYKIYGSRVQAIRSFLDNGERKLLFIYEVKKAYTPKNHRENLFDKNIIKFVFDYESNICDRLEIVIEDNPKSDVERFLLKEDFSQIHDLDIFTSAEAFCINSERNDKNFTFHKENKTETFGGVELHYTYTYIPVNGQMTKRFITVSFLDKDGKKKRYEKDLGNNK